MMGFRWAIVLVGLLVCGCHQQASEQQVGKPRVELQQLEKDRRVDEWVKRIQQNRGWLAQMNLVREAIYYRFNDTPFMVIAYRRILQSSEEPDIVFGYVLSGAIVDNIIADLKIYIPDFWYPTVCREVAQRLMELMNKYKNDVFTYIAACEAYYCPCLPSEMLNFKKFRRMIKKIDPDNQYIAIYDREDLPLHEEARLRQRAMESGIYPVRMGLLYVHY